LALGGCGQLVWRGFVFVAAVFGGDWLVFLCGAFAASRLSGVRFAISGVVFLALATHRGKTSFLGRWWFGFGCSSWPNMSVKGTRRPVAVLKVWFLSTVSDFFKVCQAARPLPLR